MFFFFHSGLKYFVRKKTHKSVWISSLPHFRSYKLILKIVGFDRKGNFSVRTKMARFLFFLIPLLNLLCVGILSACVSVYHLWRSEGVDSSGTGVNT